MLVFAQFPSADWKLELHSAPRCRTLAIWLVSCLASAVRSGTVKDTAGKMLDDKEMQAEGKVDKAKGAAHKAAGDVKDRAREAAKDVLDD